jgi:TolA-binding protein
MKRICLAAALLLSVSGCTGRKEESLSAPDPNAAIIAEIKRQMSELEKSSANELTMLKGTVEKVSKESRSAANDLQQQILLKDQRIAGLETRIQQLQNETRNLKQAQEEKESDSPAPPPSPPLANQFPVRVFGVEGMKVVTGHHTTVRQIESDETTKDVFGDKVKRIRDEDVQVDDYGYQAGFSVENPTAAPVAISVSAGLKAETFVVPAGQVLNNLAVDSAMGADLTVTVGSYTRRFPVTY